MIKQEEVFPIGEVGKPHGIRGELSFTFTTDVFDRQKCKYFILQVENILVPFFIQSHRLKSNNAGLVKFEGIDTDEAARELSKLPIYLPKQYAEAEDANITDFRYFIGFEIIDNQSNVPLGKITGINDDTANVLFELSDNGDLLIPIAEEYISAIDHSARLIYMDIPEGLLEL